MIIHSKNPISALFQNLCILLNLLLMDQIVTLVVFSYELSCNGGTAFIPVVKIVEICIFVVYLNTNQY